MTKSLKGECRECGGQFEFPAEAVGTTAACPLCGNPTELLLAQPPHEFAVPLKTIVFTVITILILVGSLVATLIALKRVERMTGRNSPVPTTPANK